MRMLTKDEAELLEDLMGASDDGSPLTGDPDGPTEALLQAGLIRQDKAGNFHITESGRETLLHPSQGSDD